MQKLILPCLLLLATVLLSCNSSQNNLNQAKKNSTDSLPNNNLKVGGLYILSDNNTSFYATKILAMDSFAVHVRTYANKFNKVPEDVNSDTLTLLIGHAPLSKESFLKDSPRLIKIEKVNDEELEGYRLYLNEMAKEPQ